MADWQERITRETAPAILAEHELRYRLVGPLVASSAVWADLGCGTGLAARSALGDARPQGLVLVDMEQQVVEGAASQLAVEPTHQIVGDLTNGDDLRRIEEVLLSFEGERVVSCFEVVEHLSSFVPLLQWSGALARRGAATFVLSVPNDAFWSIENPYHLTAWSEGAFQELRLLLPPEHTLLRQVALTGSALVSWELRRERQELTVDVGGEGAVASHFIAAFGPRHAELRRCALAVQADLLEQRRWERQREANIALGERMVLEQRQALDAQEKTIATQREQLREHTKQFDEWRSYIHELEQELGRPLSGSGEAQGAETQEADTQDEDARTADAQAEKSQAADAHGAKAQNGGSQR